MEALSRGASHVTFVENGRVAQKLLAENISKARAAAEVQVIRRDATRLGECDGDAATLVFLDPPYGSPLGARALSAVHRGGWLASGGLVVWEDEREIVPPDGFDPVEARRFGKTWLNFMRVTDSLRET